MKNIKKVNRDTAKKLKILFRRKTESELPEPDNNLKERIESTIPKSFSAVVNEFPRIAKLALSLSIILFVAYLISSLIISTEVINKNQSFTPTKKVIIEEGKFIPTKVVKITEKDKVVN